MARNAALDRRYSEIGGIIDGLNCGLVGRSPEQIIVYVNQRVLNWLGYTREELVGRHSEELLPEELRPALRDELAAVEAGDLRARLGAMLRKDGTTMPIVLLPQVYRDAKGRVVGGMSVIVELGAIHTAKPVGQDPSGLRASLDRIALELQSISLAAALPGASPLSLQHPELAALSAREKEVLTHLMAGSRVPAIAKELFISPHTVRNHLKALFRKLDVGTQAELIERVRKIAGV